MGSGARSERWRDSEEDSKGREETSNRDFLHLASCSDISVCL